MASSFRIGELLGLAPGPSPAGPDQASSPAQERSQPPPRVRAGKKRVRADATDSLGHSEEEGGSPPESEARAPCKPRSKRLRTAFTRMQLSTLEYSFRVCPYPDSYAREQIARLTAVDEARIQVWFQNRRARYRKREKPRPLAPPPLPYTLLTHHILPPPLQSPFLTWPLPPHTTPLPFQPHPLHALPAGAVAPPTHKFTGSSQRAVAPPTHDN